MTNEQNAPAVGAPLERQVMPRAWARVSNISGTTRGVFEPGAQGEAPDVELKTERMVPLYDRAVIDAAVAAERERFAAQTQRATSEMEACHSELQAWTAEDIDVPACVQEALEHLDNALDAVRA